MKRIIALLMAGVLLFAVAVSCAKQDTKQSPPSEASTETGTPPESTSDSGASDTPSDTPSGTPSDAQTDEPTDSSPSAPPAPSVPLPDNRELAGLWSRIDGSTATIPLTAAVYDSIDGGSKPPVHNATPYAYYHLFWGYADLIFVTYPSENEFAMAKEKGVEMEIIPIVKDALVFLVNKNNPVNNLTLSQLRDVYTGKTTNWKDIGGDSEPIVAYQRNEDSGSQTLFLKLLMNGQAPMKPPTEWIPESMGGLVESVSYYDNAKSAIGYSVFYYVNNMYGNNQFKLLGVDGVKPTRDTIMKGNYPLDDCYYAVMLKSTPADSPARKLVDWMLSRDGQELASLAGYIPLNPSSDAAPKDVIDPIYLGDTQKSSGTGGKTLKPNTDDVVQGSVRRPLSDMFFDGFNYVQYINGKIMEWLNSVDTESFDYTWGDYTLMRPFPGIPNDYPNYEIVTYDNRWLQINFPNGNPFFKPWDDASSNAQSFTVRLTEDISPYGVGLEEFSVTYEYGRRLLPNVDLLTLKLGIPKSPAIADKINKRLKTWTDTLPGNGAPAAQLEEFSRWCGSTDEYPYRLQPIYGTWRNLLSVSYVPQTYDGPFGYMPVLYTICFDIDTGDVVNLAAALPSELNYAHANIHTPADFTGVDRFDYPKMEYMPEGYVPKPGSVITDAWIIYNGVTINIQEPDGRILQVNFWNGVD